MSDRHQHGWATDRSTHAHPGGDVPHSHGDEVTPYRQIEDAAEVAAPDLAHLRQLLAAAKPLPWGWNSYSRIDSVPVSERYNDAENAIPNDAPDDDPRWTALPETMVCVVEHIERGDLGTAQGNADARAIEAGMNALPALLDEIESLAAWIVRADDAKHSTDWACAECVAQVQGHPDSVVDGFRCVPHRARAALLEAEPLDPEGAAR